MVWRQAYQTFSSEPSVSTPFPDGQFLALFQPSALREIELWCRLFDSENVLVKVFWLGPESEMPQLEVLVSPSRFKGWLCPTTEQKEQLTVLLADTSHAKAIAFVCLNHVMTNLMVGPPTEDAWDQFMGRGV